MVMKKTHELTILRNIKSIDETPQSVHQGINMSVANFLESISRRRSIYNIGKNVNISKDEIVNKALQPSMPNLLAWWCCLVTSIKNCGTL